MKNGSAISLGMTGLTACFCLHAVPCPSIWLIWTGLVLALSACGKGLGVSECLTSILLAGFLQGDEGEAGGLEAAAARLREAAHSREGTREELVALFVALMRAHGLLARTVRRALYPG